MALLMAGVLSAQSRPTIAVGHAGEVRSLAAANESNRAFSAGDDGKLIVWDLDSAAQYETYQLARRPLGLMAVHPTESVVAVFVRESVNAGSIVALDWVTGERLFQTPVDGRPTSLQYSPRGTYLMASLESFESMLVLSGQTGRRTGYLDDGFGVVSFVQVAPNEQNVMTYVASRGEFIYWSLRNSRELQTIQTESRLRHMTLVDPDTFRYLAAATDDEVVVVDNLRGDVLATYPARQVRSLAFDESNGRILALTEVNNRSAVLSFEFRGGRLRRLSYGPQSLDRETSTIGLVGAGRPLTLMAGSESGAVAVHDGRNGRVTGLGANSSDQILDAEIADGALFLSVGERLLSIETDLFDPEASGSQISEIRSFWVDAPGQTELHRIGDAVFAWAPSEPGTVWQLAERELESLYDDEADAPIATVRAADTGFLVLHRDGRLVSVREGQDEPSIGYQGRGLQDAVWSDSLGLVAAKSRTSAFDSSVILVDERTGETVAASTDAFLTTRLAVDPRTNDVYSIGLFGEPGSVETRLTRLSGRGLRSEADLIRESGERAEADLTWDHRTGSVLTTLGDGSLRRVSNGAEELFEPTERLPNRITSNDAVVAAVNQDGSVTLWDSRTRAHLADIFVFGDAWIGMAQNGAFYASSRTAERNLGFLAAPGSQQRVADFRVSLPFQL